MSRLSEAQIRAFYEDGFLVLRQVWAPAEVAAIAAAFDALLARARTLPTTGELDGSLFVLGDPPADRPAPAVRRVVWCGGAVPLLERLGADPRLLGPVGQLLAVDRVEQLINQAHFKLPGDGVGFPWHQDAAHRRHGTAQWRDVDGRGSFVETVTAVDPMTDDNGPLRFVAGSNRRGPLPWDPDTRALPDGLIDTSAAVFLPLDPGDVVLFGPYTVHGSAPNTSPRPRRAFLNGYAAPGANRRVYPGRSAGRTLEVPSPDG